MEKFNLISGELILNKPLDIVTFKFLQQLSNTPRLALNVDAKYGVEGEFYTVPALHYTPSANSPRTQPDLRCNWKPSVDGKFIRWNGHEDFEHPVEWIEWIISKVLSPRGYIVNGHINYKYDDSVRVYQLSVVNNVVNGKRLITDYSINILLGTVLSAQPIIIDSTATPPPKPKNKKAEKKAKKESQTKILENQIQLLEAQLKGNASPAPKIPQIAKMVKVEKKMTTKDYILIKIKNDSGIDCTLDEFKEMLKDLLEIK